MTAFDVDSIVIGAGVVGLSVARALALAGHEAWVLEAADRAGEGISSRNSGVIHAGLYYPTGSLKARLCVRGRELLYDYCERRNVAHRRLGKLVVAVDNGERAALHALMQLAQANGVPGLRWLESAEAKRLEPALHCSAALESPESGIVDVPELVLALTGEIEALGGRVACRTEVTGVHQEAAALRVEIAGGDQLRCRVVVNAAGLGATEVAAATVGLDPKHIPKVWFAAGHYYALHGHSPFQRLIYPLPSPSGLGVHLGFDIAGRCHFGPDVRWLPQPDYHFDDSQHSQFAAGIRRWWPKLKDEDLAPDFVGVRPKLSGPNQAGADFCIQGFEQHGIRGLINLFGMDSPGLTSCLALGEEVHRRLELVAEPVLRD